MLRFLLAVYLACSVGGETLLGFAHLAFSDHRHAFCQEHRWFEDLPKTEGIAREPTRDPVATDQDTRTIGASASTFGAHRACLYLNGRTFQAPIQLADQETAVAPDNRVFHRVRPRHDGVVAGLLLLAAPKTSPPFVAT